MPVIPLGQGGAGSEEHGRGEREENAKQRRASLHPKHRIRIHRGAVDAGGLIGERDRPIRA
jgi:hypothetical protein